MKPTYSLSECMVLIIESHSIGELRLLEGVIDEERERYSQHGYHLLREMIHNKKLELIDKIH